MKNQKDSIRQYLKNYAFCRDFEKIIFKSFFGKILRYLPMHPDYFSKRHIVKRIFPRKIPQRKKQKKKLKKKKKIKKKKKNGHLFFDKFGNQIINGTRFEENSIEIWFSHVVDCFSCLHQN